MFFSVVCFFKYTSQTLTQKNSYTGIQISCTQFMYSIIYYDVLKISGVLT